MRRPTEAPKFPPTTSITLRTEYSHHKAFLTEIPQIGDTISHPPCIETYSTTRDHPPFHLPIPKPLIDLYQLGNDDTRTTQQEALLTIQQLLDSDQVTTNQIDRAAKLVIDVIDGYHLLAQKIWPMAKPPTNDTTTKLHPPPITKSDIRQ